MTTTLNIDSKTQIRPMHQTTQDDSGGTTGRIEGRSSILDGVAGQELSMEEQHEAVGWVKQVAMTCNPRTSSELEEYVSAGLIGLTLAIQTWDRARGTLASWSTLLIHHEIIRYIRASNPNYLRSLDRGQVSVVSMDDTEDRFDEAVMVEGRFVHDHEQPSKRYLYGLPPKTREVIRMLFWDGLSIDEVSLRLGKSRQCVSAQRAAGLAFMRRRLAKNKNGVI
jgi:RNA polymerase sigma factor (sigma-70 family)